MFDIVFGMFSVFACEKCNKREYALLGISWSTDQVFKQTCERVQKLGLDLRQMEPKRDMDN
jgi:glycosyltransferase A (GT-A) superfamily protein (DUF2064 family)